VSRIYLDACTIIYLIEGAEPFHEMVVERLKQSQTDPKACLITSHLSRLECRVRPLRENNIQLLEKYDELFAAKRMVLTEISSMVIDRATELRAKYAFKTPDAIHLAAAIEARADVFLTGDDELSRCSDINIEILKN